MQNYYEIIIIGAGPVGLYFASKCEEANLDYRIIEGSSEIGGQLIHLYPEKQIVDIKNIENIKAKDYIELLKTKIDLNKVDLDCKVTDIKQGEKIEISTAKGLYSCEKLVIATGLGASLPRPLGLEGESDCTNIIYSVKSFDHFANKKVAIFGGGDSALDWAKEISAISNDVHLIHRRNEFRGNVETIKNCTNLSIHTPYVPLNLKIEEKKVVAVEIKNVENEEVISIPVDYVFVNFGNIPNVMKFPFEMNGSFLIVNENNQINANVFAIGDVSSYENKTRRIAPGNLEADKVFKLIND